MWCWAMMFATECIGLIKSQEVTSYTRREIIIEFLYQYVMNLAARTSDLGLRPSVQVPQILDSTNEDTDALHKKLLC